MLPNEPKELDISKKASYKKLKDWISENIYM